MTGQNDTLERLLDDARREERRRCARIAASHAKAYAASPVTLLCQQAAEDIELEILEGKDA